VSVLAALPPSGGLGGMKKHEPPPRPAAARSVVLARLAGWGERSELGGAMSGAEKPRVDTPLTLPQSEPDASAHLRTPLNRRVGGASTEAGSA
jgi:hypothetical protein